MTQAPMTQAPMTKDEIVDVRRWSKQGRKQAALARKRAGGYTREFQAAMERIYAVEMGPARSRHRIKIERKENVNG